MISTMFVTIEESHLVDVTAHRAIEHLLLTHKHRHVHEVIDVVLQTVRILTVRHHVKQTRWNLADIIRMDGRDAVDARGPRFDEELRLDGTRLGQHNPLRVLTKARLDSLRIRELIVHAHLDAVMRRVDFMEVPLRRVLDGDDALLIRNELRQELRKLRLTGRRLTADDEIHLRADAVHQKVHNCTRHIVLFEDALRADTYLRQGLTKTDASSRHRGTFMQDGDTERVRLRFKKVVCLVERLRNLIRHSLRELIHETRRDSVVLNLLTTVLRIGYPKVRTVEVHVGNVIILDILPQRSEVFRF